jgi:hypothetical protein
MDTREMVENKTTFLLKKSAPSDKFANDYFLQVQDLRSYIDSPRFIKRGSL